VSIRKLGIAGSAVVPWVVLLGVLALPGVALAAPVSPIVTIKPVGTVTATKANVSGTVDPNGSPTVTVWDFQYSKDPEVEGWTPGVSGVALASEEVTATLEGLQPSASYQVRLVATNEEVGEGVSAEPNPAFKTLPSPPTVSESVSGITASEARLEGLVNANNQFTECDIERGTSPTLAGGTFAPCEPSSLEGFGEQGVGLTVTGLTQVTTYYYRVIAQNASSEKTEGEIKHFKTGLEAPTATSPAAEVTATTATLHGVLNPNATGEAGKYEFLYKESATECAGGTPTTQEPVTGAKGQAAEAKLTGLTPGVTYTFCLLVKNAAEEPSSASAPVTFKALAVPPTPTEPFATEVTNETATLNAKLNPGGGETTYHFEYGTSSVSEHSTPEVGLHASDNTAHPATAPIRELTPGVEYHYRVVASNAAQAGHDGEEAVFTTRVKAGESGLPDGRQYEMVSPPAKDGASVFGIIGGLQNGEVLGGAAATQASEDGSSMTYITNAPAGEGVAGNSSSTQVLSERGAGGWSSQDIARPRSPELVAGARGEEYRLFSTDLSRAIVDQNLLNEPLLRDNSSGSFQAVRNESEPEPAAPEERFGYRRGRNFLAATPDLSHVLFTPIAEDGEAIYEWSSGVSRLVNILPGPGRKVESTAWLGGGITPESAAPKTSQFIGRHAVSADGARVVWGNDTELFSRDMASEETVQVDAAEPGCGTCEGGGGFFQAASSNGERVFFDDQNKLVSGGSGGGLYMYNFEAPEGTPRLTDLTPGAGAPLLLGANEAGTSLYLLSGASIYFQHESPADSGSWQQTLVATIASSDYQGYFPEGETRPDLTSWSVRVSPNGEYFAFMSRASLTGYDNRDANSGELDEEVYLYSAEADRLVCASCNPTGARPVGERDPELYPILPMDPARVWAENNGKPSWLAAAIPGWNQYSGATILTGPFAEPDGSLYGALYASRVLSDDGRLFFDSSDALVPQDVNGAEDVYEYEPPNSVAGSAQSNTCTVGSSTYSPRSGGCVSLISAGSGREASDFVDASANGNDVFFVTTDPLLPQDKGTERDMYDAHVCTSEAPCYPAQAATPPPCASTDGCRAAPAPQPGVFGASGSATFSGAGNLAAAPTPVVKVKAKSAKCKRGFVKKHNKCVKLKRSKKARKAGNKRRAH
jgi:hypothetical protein